MRLIDCKMDELIAALRPVIRTEVLAVLSERREPTAPKNYLTMREAADHFKVGYTVIRDARLRGEITGLKVGKGWRFRREDLERWAETNGEKAIVAKAHVESPEQ